MNTLDRQPSVGIAIPSLNQAPFVDEAIRSVMALQIPFHAVVQDAGSTDGSLGRIVDLVGNDKRFTVVSEADRGQADAINRAWARLHVDHPVLTWVNTDDRLRPDGFAMAVAHLARRDETCVVHGDFTMVDADGEQLGTVRRPGRSTRARLLYHYNTVPGIGVAIRTESLRQVGWLDTSLHYAFDYELWLRLLDVGQIRRVDAVTADFRWHADAKTAGHTEASHAEAESVAARHRDRRPLIESGIRLAMRAQGRLLRGVGRWREVPTRPA